VAGRAAREVPDGDAIALGAAVVVSGAALALCAATLAQAIVPRKRTKRRFMLST
jgi:hypothetical protein